MTVDELMTWSFQLKDKEQMETEVRAKPELMKTLGQTCGLHELKNLKETLTNRSAVHLIQPSQLREKTIEKSPSVEKQRYLKVKRN